MGFDPGTLRTTLETLPATRRYVIGYSGGLDSHVLLQALSRLREDGGVPELLAVHVDHGLQADAADWARHCERVCAGLDVSFAAVAVDAGPETGEAPEAAARRARYAALRALMRPDDILLTAHHRGDQAETVLLQLLRGAGPAGLAAMPVLAAFTPGWHARPLLGVGREALRRYAEHEGLTWIEDPSNTDPRFDRNYLRHGVMPRLRERWPSAEQTLARAARHQAQIAALLREFGVEDLERVRGSRDDSLSVSRLLGLSESRRANTLREWFRRRRMPPPSEAQLERLVSDVLEARDDAEPLLRLDQLELRRYRDDLYALAPLSPHDPGRVIDWDGRSPLTLDPPGCRIDAADLRGLGLDPERLEGPLTVRFRRGGERCRPSDSSETRELKKLFQEIGMPPWERDRVPLIYSGERLVAVIGHWACV
jgi:tRNA(Ile)-lysidine synthase